MIMNILVVALWVFVAVSATIEGDVPLLVFWVAVIVILLMQLQLVAVQKNNEKLREYLLKDTEVEIADKNHKE